ncbi:MAG: hypothetical protein WCP29_07860 [Acidobacteriota bacterium]
MLPPQPAPASVPTAPATPASDQAPTAMPAPPPDPAPAPVPASTPVPTSVDPVSAPTPAAAPVMVPQTEPRRGLLLTRPAAQGPPSEQSAVPPEEPPALPRYLTVDPGVAPVAVFDSVEFPAPNGMNPRDHPAVGAYFGKAMQVCAAGVAPSACNAGQQAGVLLMNPVLTGDGLIIADDSYTVLPVPFGPHAAAFGQWTPTSQTDFTAEYTFITRTFPPEANTVTGVRARWIAKVLDADTLVGYVNAYFLKPTPVIWAPMGPDEFPAYPAQALPFVTAPNGFYKDPALCLTDGCPQVFRFTLKRIRR